MAHSLIAGMTESGKTTLAKKLAALSFRRGRHVLVLDPMRDTWECTFQTADPDEFLRVFWLNESCDVFIDEAGSVVGRYNDLMNETATQGRHWGHNVHFITQRGAQLSPTVRTQCRNLFIFQMWKSDAEVYARDWNQPGLLEVPNLPLGQCFKVRRGYPLKRLNAFAA